MSYTLKPIGFIESPFKDRFGTPRQGVHAPSSYACIRIQPELQPEELLSGIEGFSHLWIISLFHANQNKLTRPKVHPPRLEGKTVGVLASRSPHRPNPLGLTLVKLEEYKHGLLWVSGVDLVDGTPILDIKPYLPEIEAIPDARGGWPLEKPWSNIAVEFSESFRSSLEKYWPKLNLPVNREQFLNLVRECLSQDPRPLVYKRLPKVKATRSYWLRLYEWDIEFKYHEDKILVEGLRPESKTRQNES